jgi:ABC-type transporter Mla subunit MlaD
MGMFEEKVDKKDFDRYQKEIKAELENISKAIASKVTDSEEDARQSAERSKAALAEVESSKTSIDSSVSQIESLAGEITTKSEELINTAEQAVQQKAQIELLHEESRVLKDEVITLKEGLSEALSESSTKLSEITQNLAQCAGLPEQLAEANNQLSQLHEKSSQVEDVLNHSVKRKGQIDELHKTILGQNIKTPDGEVEHVDGLKDELAAAYNGFEERVKKIDVEIDQVIEGINGKYNTLLEESSGEYDSVSSKLKSLLPDALAAGLSAAYEKKKTEEEVYLKDSSALFNKLIVGLVCISCLPFLVDFYLLFFKQIPLLDVINDTPKILITMLPLYFPILWLAYSTNKKVNLSKRIIEEYTHKAVLGRTYEGLSNQIDSIPNTDGISDELRVKLLFNILQVSAENPGKLISDYNSSDHPLMEALENSEKLGGSINRLENLPGFSSLVARLSSKSKKIIKEAESLVEKGLDVEKAVND